MRDFAGISLWPRPHFLILKCDTRHSQALLTVSYLTCVEYELATLPYLYSVPAGMVALVTTCGYQQVRMKSEAAVSDWFVWQLVTFRELDRVKCEL